MPKAEERARGGAVRYRTIKLKDGRYIHVAVVRRRGRRGGQTVAGPARTPKG
jgi:hypothetical protein